MQGRQQSMHGYRDPCMHMHAFNLDLPKETGLAAVVHQQLARSVYTLSGRVHKYMHTCRLTNTVCTYVFIKQGSSPCTRRNKMVSRALHAAGAHVRVDPRPTALTSCMQAVWHHRMRHF